MNRTLLKWIVFAALGILLVTTLAQMLAVLSFWLVVMLPRVGLIAIALVGLWYLFKDENTDRPPLPKHHHDRRLPPAYDIDAELRQLKNKMRTKK